MQTTVKVQINASEEYIEQLKISNIAMSFLFDYDDYTTLNDLFVYVQEKYCIKSYDENLQWSIFLNIESNTYPANEEALLKNYIHTFCDNNMVLLDLYYGIGDTYEVKDGIKYYFHSNENAHSSHVHVSYSGDEMSVNLKDFSIDGRIKNKQKYKTALKFIEENQKVLICYYHLSTNGIRIPEFSSLNSKELLPTKELKKKICKKFVNGEIITNHDF